MRTPIANALAWPERIDAGVKKLNLFDIARLDFEAPDVDRFPCLRLAYEAMQEGGTASAILNAANEIAVAAFLDKRLKFTVIADVVEKTLKRVPSAEVISLDQVLAADAEARNVASALVQ
jgi:1-deoxy-D-xylulose-5-phosphate reductoisomerase